MFAVDTCTGLGQSTNIVMPLLGLVRSDVRIFCQNDLTSVWINRDCPHLSKLNFVRTFRIMPLLKGSKAFSVKYAAYLPPSLPSLLSKFFANKVCYERKNPADCS